MKKILVILGLAVLMIASMGKGGLSSFANYYEDVPDALPTMPKR